MKGGKASMLAFLIALLLHIKPAFQCIKKEKKALLQLKEGIVDYSGWLSSWGAEESNGNCCQWRGIGCDSETGHVVMLDLRGSYDNELRGNISSALLELKQLNHLDLSYNRFSWNNVSQFIGSLQNLRYLNLSITSLRFKDQSIISLGNLSNLQYLGVSSDYDSSAKNLAWLSNLSSLKHLDLSSSNLSEADDWFQVIFNKLPHLTHLSLSDCQLRNIPRSYTVFNSSLSLVSLDLSNNNLTNSIYQWLFNFTNNLVFVDLTENNLQGPIPETFGNMNSLETLDLSGNQLEGGIPMSLGNLCRLRKLDFSYNNLSGQFSELVNNLSRCTAKSLEDLDLGYNQIHGSLSNMNIFSSLKRLYLGTNKLNGSIMESIGNLLELEELWLDMNQFRGLVANNFLGAFPKLRGLSLSSNALILNFSSDCVQPSQLEYIYLANCQLGPQFPHWLRAQKNYSGLNISGAGISDTVPRWFWESPPNLETLDISGNQLYGRIPNLSWRFNGFPRLILSHNEFEGPIPLFPQNISSLDLSGNKFIGTTSFLCEVSQDYLEYLDLSDNLLSGELEDCLMRVPNLNILNLANNMLHGKIPNSICFLSQLQSLKLHKNRFLGPLPQCLQNCSSLRALDLSENNLYGDIPAWIGESLSYLVLLSLRANEFSGSIPSNLCHLSSLQILDLSSNSIWGIIPSCFNNLSAMAKKESTGAWNYWTNYHIVENFLIQSTYIEHAWLVWKGRESLYEETLGMVKIIDLSSNKLTGNIPEEIMTLVGLVSLNLSRNNLIGHIPPMIGQLKSLDFLDLSRNMLSGHIPSSLSEIDEIGVLDLSYNNLSGPIPSGTQLQSFNASTYTANAGLCGDPLPNKCLQEEENQGSSVSSEDRFITPWFYIGTVFGMIIGFWGVFGSLLLNRSWRRAYFQFLDKVTDRLYVEAALRCLKFGRKP